ncbi:hypothetical protein ASF53_13460 [Methylobacterium sp. Leaf123]|nr:hypothetical protein ASF53_13460 [Methylobacterium sp. Leaf123]
MRERTHLLQHTAERLRRREGASQIEALLRAGRSDHTIPHERAPVLDMIDDVRLLRIATRLNEQPLP